MADISLTAGIRSNLVSLQQTTKMMDQTTRRLATGKKVATAVDNPTNFFAAQSYNDRATGLQGRLDGMGEAIQQVKAADNGITALRGFLSQMKGVVNDALANADSNARADLGKQFNELIKQASSVAKDSGYAGINLLTNEESRTVQFHESIGESTLKIQGFDVNAATNAIDSDGELTASSVTGSGGQQYALAFKAGSSVVGIQSYGTSTAASGHEVNWASTGNYGDDLNTVVKQIEDMEGALKTQASKLANNLAVITQREDFTKEAINVLQEGADKLTLADLNEEGANLLALQTASQLGVQSLSLASQQSQQVLRIIG